MLTKFFLAPKIGGSSEYSLHDRLRLLTFSAATLLISLRLDGWKLPISETVVQLLLVPYSLLFIFLGAAFLWPAFLESFLQKNSPPLLAAIERMNTLRLVILVAIISELFTFGLLVVQQQSFSRFGYSLNLRQAIPIMLVILGGLFVFLGIRVFFTPKRFFYFVLAAYALVYLLSIGSFPLNPGRSDMLPNISLSNRAILNGHNPYDPQYSLVPESGNSLNYFPANVLFYLPGDLLRLDLRFLNLVCTLAVALLIYKFVSPPQRPLVGFLVSIFLLCPYFQYRHDLYEIPEWLVLALVMVCLQRRHPLLAGLVFGAALALSPFNWVIFPFFLLYLYRAYSLKFAALAFGLSVLVGLVFVLPFVLWSAPLFFDNVLGGFDKKAGLVFTPSVNLSYFLYQPLPLRFAKVVQGLDLLVVFYFAWRKLQTLADCFAWMAVALFLFIALNSFINTYFYFFIFFLLVLQRTSFSSYETKKQPAGAASLSQTQV